MITDNVQPVLEAIATIVDGDTELQALFGRTSGLIVPFDVLVVAPVPPIIAYLPVQTFSDTSGYAAQDVQFAVFALSPSVANLAVSRLIALLQYPAFASLAMDVAANPSRLPLRQWPGAGADIGDPVTARADVTLAFLIPR